MGAWRDTAAEGSPDWNDSQLQAGLRFLRSFFLSEKLKKQEEKDRGKSAEMLSPHIPEQGLTSGFPRQGPQSYRDI